ncbi:sulfurtransferase [Anaerolineales bacterium HSG6]|nr:sulfurtransferase [Anaerolineales bacterium HSG6]
MSYKTLISTAELAEQLDNPALVIVDCRFYLADTEQGRQLYQTAHLPGAVYAYLDDDLSGTIIAGQTSRHPLPEIETLSQTLSAWGIDSLTQVIVYDDKGGAIAARLWWMLNWLGHDSVAVLDGGWPRWEQEKRPTRSGDESVSPKQFTPNIQTAMLADLAEVQANHAKADYALFDSRIAARYRGEVELLDPIAGHIPGAVNAPFPENMADGVMLPPEQLRARFEALLGDTPASSAVFYCGSGVTAAHNLLAIAHVGLGRARMYAGSWSEWITQPNPLVATDK